MENKEGGKKLIEEEEEENEGEGEEEEEIAYSKIIRTPGLGFDESLETMLYPGLKTIPEMFEHVSKIFKNRTLYIYRDLVKSHIEINHTNQREVVTKEFGNPKTLSFAEVYEHVRAISSGLCRLNLEKLKKGSKVGIFLDTCKEWMICAQSIFRAGMVVVTAYSNLGYEGLRHVVQKCELSTLVCSSECIKDLDLFIAPHCPTLEYLIIVGAETYKSMFFKVIPFDEILEQGRKNVYIPIPPKPEDLAVIMYTSGTTGEPKGVMMSQYNLCSVLPAVKKAMALVDSDRYISYLPLAHVFELAAHCSSLFCGITIGIGTPRTLIAKPGGAKYVGDLETIKPTILVGVPRVWDTIKKGVLAKIRAAGFIKRALFKNVFDRKRYYLENGDKVSQDVFGEGLVFGKIRKLVGGNLRAPLSRDTHLFLQCVLGSNCKVSQGYGLTETCAGNFWTSEDPKSPFSPDTIGWPITCCEGRLRSVPKMGYSVRPEDNEDGRPRGELTLRGPIVSLGYFGREDLTKESYDNGWFRTGDICQMNKDDSITIIDRKKNIVKLSQGEYIAPESLEMVYSISPFVFPNGIMVEANPFKSYAIAIVIVDPVYLKEWMASKNIKKTSELEVIRLPELKKDVLDSFSDLAKKYGKKGFERIRDVVLVNDIWTPENQMLTASSKLKRRNIAEKYEKEIQEVYKRIP